MNEYATSNGADTTTENGASLRIGVVVGENSTAASAALFPTNRFSSLLLNTDDIICAALEPDDFEPLLSEPGVEMAQILELIHDITYNDLRRTLMDERTRNFFVRDALRRVVGNAVTVASRSQRGTAKLPENWYDHVVTIAVESTLYRTTKVLFYLKAAFPQAVPYEYDRGNGTVLSELVTGVSGIPFDWQSNP